MMFDGSVGLQLGSLQFNVERATGGEGSVKGLDGTMTYYLTLGTSGAEYGTR